VEGIMADISKLMKKASGVPGYAKDGFKPSAPVNLARPKPVKVPEPTKPSNTASNGQDNK
jgi:hypothetical protein